MPEQTITYLYKAIDDTQSTIRAIDAKFGVISAILLLPFAKLGRITAILSTAVFPSIVFGKLAIVIVWATLWLLAFWLILKGVSPIASPAQHVKLEELPVKGSFYAPNLFSHCLKNIFYQDDASLRSKMSINEYISQLPTQTADTIAELAFEKMKLVYIRDLKMLRQQLAFKLVICWFLLGIFIYLSF